MSRAAADATVFHAISDPTRRAVLDRLKRGEATVGELAEPFSVTLSALSQHLAVLLRANLVSRHKQGRHRVYRLEAGPLEEVAQWIREYDRFWEGKLDALGDYLEKK